MPILFGLKVLAISITVLGASSVQADAAAGKTLYNSCIACHGDKAQGNPAMNAPALTGQSTAYLSRQLKHFKAGIRGGDSKDTFGAQMRGMTATLVDDQAIADVSDYIAALAVTGPASKAQGDLRKGNNLYQGNCGSCHGGKAEGNTALNSPRLAGLDGAYLIRQYNNFKTGIRGSHPEDRFGKQMKFMANSLPTEKDLQDVVAYIHAQTVE
ncbi:c-type cytochrome [Oceanicoccus sagamiensis]|uniref:Cytochrome C n=1 Tax=Oceanicoccus sagamiensis TaxID=716816 RepID=A0A1X9N562_9GAMM|nr:c-type cytochrome [Oceanicoccus sagamiensis]ARN73250.1 cytochrome C [Oceanicoccus sagamiensis]